MTTFKTTSNNNTTNNNFDPYAIGNCKYGYFQVHRLSPRKYAFLCKGIYDNYNDCTSAAFVEHKKDIYKTDFYSLICVRLSNDIETYTLSDIEFAKGKRDIKFLLNTHIMGNDGETPCGLSVKGSGSAEIIMTLGSFNSTWVEPSVTKREHTKLPVSLSQSAFNKGYRLPGATIFVNEVYGTKPFNPTTNTEGLVGIFAKGDLVYSACGNLYDIAEFLYELKDRDYFSTYSCDRAWHSIPVSTVTPDNATELRDKAETLFADLLKNGYTSTCEPATEGAETPSADNETDNEVTIDHDKLSWYYSNKIYHKVFDKVGGCPADYETFKFAVEDYASSLAQVTLDHYEPVGEYMHVMHISNADYDTDSHKLSVEFHDFVGKGETPQIGFCFRPKDSLSYNVGSYDGKKDKCPLLNYDKVIVADFVADNDTQVGA